MIPAAPSQWSGLVIHLQAEDQFTVNVCNNFGLTSAGGVYGMVADAGVDIFRGSGMGPMAKWVDDHISFRIPHVCLPKYNARHAAWHHEILNHGGHRQNGSRIWYRGKNLPDGSPKEFDEDCTTSLEDLSNTSPHSTEDQLMQMQTSTKFLHNLEFSGNHPNWFPSAWRYLISAFAGTSDVTVGRP
jgi:hypothetical protein